MFIFSLCFVKSSTTIPGRYFHRITVYYHAVMRLAKQDDSDTTPVCCSSTVGRTGSPQGASSGTCLDSEPPRVRDYTVLYVRRTADGAQVSQSVIHSGSNYRPKRRLLYWVRHYTRTRLISSYKGFPSSSRGHLIVLILV